MAKTKAETSTDVPAELQTALEHIRFAHSCLVALCVLSLYLLLSERTNVPQFVAELESLHAEIVGPLESGNLPPSWYRSQRSQAQMLFQSAIKSESWTRDLEVVGPLVSRLVVAGTPIRPGNVSLQELKYAIDGAQFHRVMVERLDCQGDRPLSLGRLNQRTAPKEQLVITRAELLSSVRQEDQAVVRIFATAGLRTSPQSTVDIQRGPSAAIQVRSETRLVCDARARIDYWRSPDDWLKTGFPKVFEAWPTVQALTKEEAMEWAEAHQLQQLSEHNPTFAGVIVGAQYVVRFAPIGMALILLYMAAYVAQVSVAVRGVRANHQEFRFLPAWVGAVDNNWAHSGTFISVLLLPVLATGILLLRRVGVVAAAVEVVEIASVTAMSVYVFSASMRLSSLISVNINGRDSVELQQHDDRFVLWGITILLFAAFLGLAALVVSTLDAFLQVNLALPLTATAGLLLVLTSASVSRLLSTVATADLYET